LNLKEHLQQERDAVLEGGGIDGATQSSKRLPAAWWRRYQGNAGMSGRPFPPQARQRSTVGALRARVGQAGRGLGLAKVEPRRCYTNAKTPGCSPAFSFVVFRQAPKNLELFIDREPVIALNEAGAAGRVEVCNDVVHG
jgi:hypothetical protein